MSTCCGIAKAQVGASKAEIARLARQAARTSERGRPIDKYVDAIAVEKAKLTSRQHDLETHDCDHEETPA